MIPCVWSNMCPSWLIYYLGPQYGKNHVRRRHEKFTVTKAMLLGVERNLDDVDYCCIRDNIICCLCRIKRSEKGPHPLHFSKKNQIDFFYKSGVIGLKAASAKLERQGLLPPVVQSWCFCSLCPHLLGLWNNLVLNTS